MNNLKSILALSLSSFFFLNCTKNSDDKIICGQSIPPVYLTFNVVKSSSDQDLFFSEAPVFSVKEMYFFKTKDISRKDTIRPTVEGTGSSRTFRLALDNTKLQDTLIMKVGNEPDDKLISKLKKSDEVCSVPVIDKIFVNDVDLTASQGKYQIKKQL